MNPKLNQGSQRGLEKQMQRQLIPSRLHSDSIEEPKGNWIERLSRRALGMRRKVATVVLVSLSLSLAGYAIFGHDGLVAYQHKQRHAAELHQQILSLQKENQRLALHDQRLQSDRDTIEYEAREQMHYTRPGEVIYTLPEAPSSNKSKR